MKTSNYQENHYQQIVEFGRSRPWLPLVGLMYALVAAITLTQFYSRLIPELSVSSIQFFLSLSALAILSIIGLVLFFNNYQTLWGFSFLFYAFSFLGLSLRIFGLPVTDINNPLVFHIWFLPLVLLISGVWIGTSKLHMDELKVNYVPAFLILLVGEGWFLVGLFILKSVTVTIFGLIYGLFIPVVLFFTYTWFRLAKNSTFVSTWLITLGFLLMAVTYFFWNPWMSSDLDPLYNIFFSIFNVSLLVILGGFFTLSKDLQKSLDSS
ncbi:MAG: hypothetical protein JSV04_10150 [Candidatus Heimdallarchaeota archaeon]|nr:MAG: hypothetical protein JSV04_10150 [Candidatus Heimdallarchaeota archaeon]